MWTAVRPRSTELKLQNMELKQEHFRQSRHKQAQVADQHHQEDLEFDVFCSLDFAVIFLSVPYFEQQGYRHFRGATPVSAAELSVQLSLVMLLMQRERERVENGLELGAPGILVLNIKSRARGVSPDQDSPGSDLQKAHRFPPRLEPVDYRSASFMYPRTHRHFKH